MRYIIVRDLYDFDPAGTTQGGQLARDWLVVDTQDQVVLAHCGDTQEYAQRIANALNAV